MGYAVVLGVFVDLDHFAIARYETGDWSALRRCVTDPRLAFVDQGEIFPEEAIHPLQRLLTHHVLGGVLVPVTWVLSPYYGAVTAITLYAHVLADLIWDVWRGDHVE